MPIPTAGRDTYHDAHTPGLILRVTPAGAKSFAWYRKLAGRPVRVTIGSFPAVTVEMARNRAQALSGDVARGRDPQAEHQARRGEATLRDLWEHWLTIYGKPRKRTWRDDERQFNKYLVPFHNRRLSSIRMADVAKWHATIGETHGHIQANRAKALLGTLFNKAHEVGFAGPNPCKAAAFFPEQSRERFLLPSEMRGFFAALAAVGQPWHDFFQLCLFTGARRGNVASMQWDEIDLDRMVWTIPGSKTKNKRPAVIALAPPAVMILKLRWDRADGSQWVFPADSSSGHVIDPRAAWERLRRASGLRDLRMHDLRRSLGSWQATAGASLAIIGASLGHADLKSTQVYSRLQLDPIRESVEKAATAMLAAGGVKLIGMEASQENPDGSEPGPPDD